MAFTVAERVQIRMYIGFSNIFLQQDPRLENAITAVQSIADGGVQPTTDAEAMVRAILVKLTSNDASIDALADFSGATAADKGDAEIDAAREQARLQSVGRMYIARLCRMFDTYPVADVYSASDMLSRAYPTYPRTAY